MTDEPSPASELGFEAFGTACGLAVVTGALSVVAPTFDVLTLTLVALALAGWASLHRREAGRPRSFGRRPWPYAVPLVLFGIAATVFFDPPEPMASWRALLLALGVMPLWVAERRRPGPPRPPAGVR